MMRFGQNASVSIVRFTCGTKPMSSQKWSERLKMMRFWPQKWSVRYGRKWCILIKTHPSRLNASLSWSNRIIAKVKSAIEKDKTQKSVLDKTHRNFDYALLHLWDQIHRDKGKAKERQWPSLTTFSLGANKSILRLIRSSHKFHHAWKKESTVEYKRRKLAFRTSTYQHQMSPDRVIWISICRQQRTSSDPNKWTLLLPTPKDAHTRRKWVA